MRLEARLLLLAAIPEISSFSVVTQRSTSIKTLFGNGKSQSSFLSNDASSTRLNMAWDAKEETTMFDGYSALTKERDACGVGFIANTNSEDGLGSHLVLEQGLTALDCMEHRGACGGDGVSGDGAGIMTQIPWKLFPEYQSQNPGVGMIFLPRDPTRRDAVKKVIEGVCSANELNFLGWREVPVNPDVLGDLARNAMPSIWQFFVEAPERLIDSDKDEVGDGFERTLYLVRRRFSVELNKRGLKWDDDDGDVYVCSFSARTIVYKGMVQGCILPQFYKDLTNPDYTTPFVIYHRRFSTNTNPKWPLAQPMRVLGHNGEINTLLGNMNWVKAREAAKSIPIALDYDIDEDTDGWLGQEMKKTDSQRVKKTRFGRCQSSSEYCGIV